MFKSIFSSSKSDELERRIQELQIRTSDLEKEKSKLVTENIELQSSYNLFTVGATTDRTYSRFAESLVEQLGYAKEDKGFTSFCSVFFDALHQVHGEDFNRFAKIFTKVLSKKQKEYN